MATLPEVGRRTGAVRTIACAGLPTREINEELCALRDGDEVVLSDPGARHSLAVALTARCRITIEGDAGYYAAALCAGPEVAIAGHAGNSLAENLDGGVVTVDGDCGANLAATAHSGLVVVAGSAGARAAISLKGATVLVGGDVGAYSGFMMQSGTLVVCGDAGPALGDSIYEGVIYVGGAIASLGADATAEPATAEEYARIGALLVASGLTPPPALTRVSSLRELYLFDARSWSPAA